MQAKSVDDIVRKRLRDLRTQQGLTLQDVATRAAIDVSTLSRLESGKRRLALDHLPRLASALAVSTDELLREPESEDPRVRGSSHTRHGVTYWPLTSQPLGKVAWASMAAVQPVAEPWSAVVARLMVKGALELPLAVTPIPFA